VIILITIALLVLALIAFLIIRGSVTSTRCGDAAGPSSLDLHWSPFSTTTHRVIERLSRDDARDLLIDDDRADLADLRAEQSTLRMRLDQLAEQFADGALSASQLRAGSERLRARLADVEAKMVHVDRAPLLADLVTASDVRKAWEAVGLDCNWQL
jgi:hypothetical protein